MELHEIIHEELIGWGIFLKDVPYKDLDIEAQIAIRWMAKRIKAKQRISLAKKVNKSTYQQLVWKHRILQKKYETSR